MSNLLSALPQTKAEADDEDILSPHLMTEFDPLQSAYVASESYPDDTADSMLNDIVNSLHACLQGLEEQALQTNNTMRPAQDLLIHMREQEALLREELTSIEQDIANLPSDASSEQRRPLEEQRRSLDENYHAVRLLLQREDLASTQAVIQSPLAVDPNELKADAVATLTQRISELDASRETVSVVPRLYIDAYAEYPGRLTIHAYNMPEGLELRLGNAVVSIPKGDKSFQMSLAGSSPAPQLIAHPAKVVRSSTGEVLIADAGLLGIRNNQHIYTYRNGYGDKTRRANPALTSITHEVVLPLSAEKTAEREQYSRLLSMVQSEGQHPAIAAAQALSAIESKEQTFASAAEATIYLSQREASIRFSAAHRTSETLIQEILHVSSEKPDVTTPATLATDLDARRKLLEEANIVLALMQEQGAPQEQLVSLSRQLDLLQAENHHSLQALGTFIDALQRDEISAEEYRSFLRSGVSAVDLTALNGNREWTGAVQTHTATPLKIMHIKSTTVPAIDAQSMHASLALPAGLTGIDLSQYKHLVTGAMLQLSFDGTPPTVTAYRDGQNIGSLTPDAEGCVHIQDLGGITHLLISHDAESIVSLENISVMTDADMPNETRAPLSALTSREIALAMTPSSASWKEWTDHRYHNAPQTIWVDPTQYTLVSVRGYSKDATMKDINYFIGNSTHDRQPLPAEFITKLDPYTWIIHPGTPRLLYVDVKGATIWSHGRSQGYEWEYSQKTEQALNAQELLPSGPMKVTITNLDWDIADSDGDHNVYWMDGMPSQLQQRRWPVGTGDMWFKAIINNDGGTGGIVTIDIFGVPKNFDSQNLGNPQHTLTVDLPAGGQKLLHAWANIPNITETGSIVARVTYPDGHSEIIHIAGTAPYREMSFSSRSSNENGGLTTQIINPYSESEQDRIRRALSNIVQALIQQGKFEKAEHVRQSIPIAVSGGAGSGTIYPSVRADLAAMGIIVPEETIIPTQEEVQMVHDINMQTIKELLNGSEIAMGMTDYLCGLENGKYWEDFFKADLRSSSFTLGTIQGERIEPLEMKYMRAQGSETIRFELAEDSMVNFWVNSTIFPKDLSAGLTENIPLNLALQLEGNGVNFLADKTKGLSGAGESISCMLPAGNYTLTVMDKTNYQSQMLVTSQQLSTMFIPKISVEMNIKKYNTAHIEGRISIPERDETMPVSMSVAEFIQKEDGSWVRKEKNDTQPLDPTKPVWVIIHGMDSSETSSVISELARAFHGYAKASNIQIVTVDWKDAARDGLVMTQDAPWAVAVGQWVARRLINLGIPPQLINTGGWSHGSYVAFEMAREIERIKPGEQINAFVALDAANNIPWVSGYDHKPVNFAGVSRNSIAIDSSIIAGSDSLAKTADVSFSIQNSNSTNTIMKHRMAVTVLTEILDHERKAPGHFSQFLSLERIMSSAESNQSLYNQNAFCGIFEGIIDVEICYEEKSDGTYPRAIPQRLIFRKPGATIDNSILSFDTLS